MYLGKKRVLLAVGASCFLMGIPIFPDTVSLLLVSICSLLAYRTGISMTRFACVAQISITTSSLVPPTPGPVAAAAALGLSLGEVIPWGILVSIPGYIATILYSRTLKADIKPREQYLVEPETEKYPSFFSSIAPILVPIVLIIFDNVVRSVSPDTRLAQVSSFIGDPLSALFIGCLTALFLQTERCGNQKNIRMT